MNLYRAEHIGEEPVLGFNDGAELAQLRRDNQTLRRERQFLKKATVESTVQRRRRIQRRIFHRVANPGDLPTIVPNCF